MAYAAPLAILTDVHGKVQVKTGGKTKAGSNGTQLQTGDAVQVASGGATVFYVSRAPQTLKAGQQVVVGAAGAAGAPSVWRNVYAGLSNGFARRNQTTPAAMRPGKTIALSPAPGHLLTDRPVFAWYLSGISAADFADYLVTVRDMAGKTVWEASTTGFSIAYSADAPALAPGGYSWIVTPRRTGDLGEAEASLEAASTPATFDIADLPNRKIVEVYILMLAKDTGPMSLEVRRTTKAAALISFDYRDEAQRTLLPELTPKVLDEGSFPKQVDGWIAQASDTELMLLRNIFLAAGQGGLVTRIDEKK